MSAFWDHLERSFGRILATSPRPDAPIPQGEAVDCTDVQIANTDIPVPAWEPPQGDPERPVLPGHEHQLDPGSRVELLAALDDMLAAALRMVAECPAGFAGAERRA